MPASEYGYGCVDRCRLDVHLYAFGLWPGKQSLSSQQSSLHSIPRPCRATNRYDNPQQHALLAQQPPITAGFRTQQSTTWHLSDPERIFDFGCEFHAAHEIGHQANIAKRSVLAGPPCAKINHRSKLIGDWCLGCTRFAIRVHTRFLCFKFIFGCWYVRTREGPRTIPLSCAECFLTNCSSLFPVSWITSKPHSTGGSGGQNPQEKHPGQVHMVGQGQRRGRGGGQGRLDRPRGQRPGERDDRAGETEEVGGERLP